VQRAEDAGAEILTATTATGWIGPTALSLTSAGGIRTVQARAVLLATGCRERPRAARLIPGTRPAGVLTTGALQQMVYLHRQPPGARAVVVGAEHVSFSAVLTLAHGGATTVAMVTEHPVHQSYAPFRWLTATRLRVPILTSSRLEAIHGHRRVEAVAVRDLRSGRVDEIACDTVVCTGDWIPDHELARRGEIAIDHGGGAPEVDLGLRTSRPGVFAAGNLLHAAETADIAALSGRHAAAAVRRYLDWADWPHRLRLRCEAPLRWVSPAAIGAGSRPPRGRFILRTSEVAEGVVLTVTQGGRQLWWQRWRRLLPDRPIHVAANWLAQVELDGPAPVFRIVAE
jgi:thioredoxin reductase